MTPTALLLAYLMTSPPSFDGSKAGERRRGRRHQALLVPAGQVHDGQPARRAGAAAGRGPGRGDAHQGLLGRASTRSRRASGSASSASCPGELTAELPEGDDYPVGNVNFAEAEAFCRKLTELARKSGELPAGLGVPAAHRGAVGVRLPGRDHDRHGVRRQAQQQAGELPGQAVQRRRGRGRRWGRRPRSAATRRTPGACTTCTATPSSGAGTGTTRSCPAASIPTCTSARRGEPNRDGTFRGPPGRRLDRRRLALPVGLSAAVRARAALRPHRLPGRGRPAVEQARARAGPAPCLPRVPRRRPGCTHPLRTRVARLVPAARNLSLPCRFARVRLDIRHSPMIGGCLRGLLDRRGSDDSPRTTDRRHDALRLLSIRSNLRGLSLRAPGPVSLAHRNATSLPAPMAYSMESHLRGIVFRRVVRDRPACRRDGVAWNGYGRAR